MMNDVTPPTQKQQKPEVNTEVAQPLVDTHVAVQTETKAKKPRRVFKLKNLLVAGLAIAFVAAGTMLAFKYVAQNKVYRIGTQAVSKQEFSKTQDAFKLARDGKEAPGGATASQKEAEDRVVMLAGLKAEADKQNIPYDTATVDGSLKDVFAKQGGREAYMAFMKNTYGWSEADVYQYRTLDYLQGKLSNSILMNKNFTVVYFRWDIIKERDGSKAPASIAVRQNDLETKFRPFLESGQSFVQLSSQVEAPKGATQDQTQKAYEASQGSPIILQTENPGDITYSQAFGEKTGQDPKAFFATATTKGAVIGPQTLSDGRVLLARLESTGAGKYANWDDYLSSLRKQIGLVDPVAAQKSKVSLLKKITRLIGFANILKPQVAHALIKCADHQVPVNFTFDAYELNTNLALTGDPFAATATRDSQTCDMANYTANGYSVSGSGRYRTVTKTIWGVPGSITLDCVGYDWAFYPPPVVNHTFDHTRSQGTYANGGSIRITFFYNKNVPQPTCSFSASPTSITSGSSATLSWSSSDGTGWGISPSVGNVGASGSRAVNPTSSTTYTFVVTNSAGSRTCPATVTVTAPPVGAPTCSFTSSPTSVPAGGGSSTLTWSSSLGTSWSIDQGIGAVGASGSKSVTVSATTTYTFSVTNSTATTRCSATVTVGENPNPPPPPPAEGNTCVAAFAPTYGSNEVTITKGQTVSARVTGYANGSQSPIGGVYFVPADFTQDAGTGNFTASPQVTTNYNILATMPDGSTAQCSARVVVSEPPLAPAYRPWLQTKRGNVLALGSIVDQPVGQLGSINPTNTDKEAEYVVMGYVVTNFCSRKSYNFGGITGSGCTYTSGYHAKSKNNPYNPVNDTAVESVEYAVAHPATEPNCNDSTPYVIKPYISGSVLPVDLGATDACPVMYKTTGATTLPASSITFGRGTLYVPGDLLITGNIINTYGVSYSSINKIPNLGIVVKGNITIAAGVTQIDASLHATGKIKTCDAYPSVACAQKLTIRGKLAAGGGFELGRNYFSGSNDPAELVIGSGLIEAFPPPGFTDVSSGAGVTQTVSNESNPRF